MLGFGFTLSGPEHRPNSLNAPLQVGIGSILFSKGGAGQDYLSQLGRRTQESIHHHQKIELLQAGQTVAQASVDQVRAVAN